mgnify:CR=1
MEFICPYCGSEVVNDRDILSDPGNPKYFNLLIGYCPSCETIVEVEE